MPESSNFVLEFPVLLIFVSVLQHAPGFCKCSTVRMQSSKYRVLLHTVGKGCIYRYVCQCGINSRW